MNIVEALEAMERGEKVIRGLLRNHITKPYLWIENNGVLFYQGEEGKRYELTRIDLTATDWEIYVPKPVLNPCGCGGKAVSSTKESVGSSWHVVECRSCGCMTAMCATKQIAINDWNTAHPIQQPKKLTNFEKYITAELLEDATDECDECTCFVSYMADMLGEHAPNIDCSKLQCGECCKRFVQWANAIAEEVKE